VIDIATRDLVTIGMDESLGWARQLFEHHRFHHIVVVDAGRVAGVLSDRDLLKHLSPFIGAIDERKRDTDSLNKRAQQVMTRALVTAPAEMSACQACELMLASGVTCLPVVSDAMAPLGIVTWRDLLRWAGAAAGCAVAPKSTASGSKASQHPGPSRAA
jgi:acetoin utilization protein AcuB